MHNRAGNQDGGATVPARDVGVTFIEILVTITLLALVVIPTLAATASLIRSSSVSEEASEVETVLVNAADRVNRAPRSCDMTGPVEAAVETAGWDPVANVDVQQFYRDTSGGWVAGPPAAPACPAASGSPIGTVQLVRITVTGPDEGISRTIEVVKSDY